jgi:alkanesulfonate monooxygenase SsuD/methylene tetrahydromethanopterin reductase-like flavin-dependent oxidoreductase (luciferase family)
MSDEPKKQRKRGHPAGRLTPKHQKAIEVYAQTGSQQKAVRAAGFTGKRAGTVIFNRPEVQAEVERVRAAVAKKTEYDLEAAMEECNAGMLFARETENANALAKFIELKSKLMGLLIDKSEVRNMGMFQIHIAGVPPLGALPPTPAAVQLPTVAAVEEAEVVESTDDDIFS